MAAGARPQTGRLSQEHDTFSGNFGCVKSLPYNRLLEREGVSVKASKSWVWQPPAEAIDSLASVFSAHWAAAKSQQLDVFWPKAARWRTQLTTAREAASSSDTLPDLHPC